ncbi:MAG: hypothetical protein ABI337_08830 [Nitrososphaera sp.]|jgi:hypothetical protein
MASLQKQIPRIFCQHKNSIVDSHEVLCGNCGVVLDSYNVQEYSVESTLNLFQQIEMGGKTAEIEAAKRIHKERFRSSAFSNACVKLRLPTYAALDAWKTFSKLEKISVNANTALAIFSLFTSCKRFAIPRTENQIREAVMFAFSIKRTPSILKSLSFVHSLLISITECEKNKIVTNQRQDSFEYYLNVYLNDIQKPVDKETLKDNARRLAKTFSGNDEYRARMAVRMLRGGL